MKDATTRTQTMAPRKIVLRQMTPEARSTTPPPQENETSLVLEPQKAPQPDPSATGSLVKLASLMPTQAAPAAAENASEIARLEGELEDYRRSLEQWTRAEAEWARQRRLFQLMTETVSDLIVLTDHQGHRVWNNPAYSQVLGYEQEELAGTYALSEIHPDDRIPANQALTSAIEQGVGELAEFRLQKRDGDWVHLKSEIIPLADVNGQIESVVIVSVDVTEKKKLEEALTIASTEATATGMVEGLARDFDQIVTNVIGNLTIAKNLNGSQNAVAVRLNEIERSLQRARDLIEQMFSLTPHAGQTKVRVAVEPIVQETVAAVTRGTMIRAEYVFPRNLPEVEVDLEAFSHAIRNILTNSVQAMDNGVVRISAETIPHDQFYRHPELPLKPGDYISIHIQDQGHGISEKALARVFEPYFTTRQGSQGLGLTTALSSIQRMGGTILLDSTAGVGTTVSVYLPCVQGESVVTASTPASSARSSGMLAKLNQKRRILLMDDEQMILDIVSRMLGHLGYGVTTCTDGSQVIAAFTKAKSHSEPFDVVIMDLIIPNGVGGQDAVHTLKKIDPGARVIASSGHLDHPVMIDPIKHGFNAVLEKPYKLEKLQQVIEAVVNG